MTVKSFIVQIPEFLSGDDIRTKTDAAMIAARLLEADHTVTFIGGEDDSVAAVDGTAAVTVLHPDPKLLVGAPVPVVTPTTTFTLATFWGQKCFQKWLLKCLLKCLPKCQQNLLPKFHKNF